jgi:hypothetical protein
LESSIRMQVYLKYLKYPLGKTESHFASLMLCLHASAIQSLEKLKKLRLKKIALYRVIKIFLMLITGPKGCIRSLMREVLQGLLTEITLLDSQFLLLYLGKQK